MSGYHVVDDKSNDVSPESDPDISSSEKVSKMICVKCGRNA